MRIFPLYYLALLLVYLVLKIPSISAVNPILDPRHLDDYLYYVTFTQNLFFSFKGWGVTDLLNHFWSLAIEEQFYLVWPFVILILPTSRVLSICLALIPISLLVRNYNFDSDFSYVFTLARIDAMAIGAMFALLVRYYRNFLNAITLPLFLICISVLIIISLNSVNLGFRNVYFVRFGYTIFAFLFASIITLVYDTTVFGKMINKVLSISILRFFGKYSYGLYIYHWLLYKGVYIYLETHYVFSKKYILLFLLLVILISMLSFHTYEKFFLGFKHRLDHNPPKNKGSFVPVEAETSH